jgi:hypothetical protein
MAPKGVKPTIKEKQQHKGIYSSIQQNAKENLKKLSFEFMSDMNEELTTGCKSLKKIARV